jgi:predicted ATPase
MKEWEKNNENILDSIAYKLNKFLIKFNIQLIKIDKNQKSYDDLIFKDLSNENIIKYENLSTGTKNIIATFIPLKIHNPKDSIILIDEPENSFYPDIQRKLTELYMEAGENNQVIFATHSPIIASSFEPWEVVELKFDKNNQVYRELYYEGENHVDNYTLDPRMLTWTGILTDIFDLKEDSNFAFREKKLMEYIRLEHELRNIQDKSLTKEKFEELMKLSNLLGLNGNEKD